MQRLSPVRTPRSTQGPRLLGRREGCLGVQWSVNLGRSGTPGAAWCPWRAEEADTPPILRSLADSARPDADTALAGWRRIRRMPGSHRVILNPAEDLLAHPHGARTEDRAALLSCLRDLLTEGASVALTTRAGLDEAAALLPLAARWGKALHVRVGLFGATPALEATWERHLPNRTARLALIRALIDAGASVEVELGPIIPFVNDDLKAWIPLCRAIARAGARVIVPRVIAGGPSLIRLIGKEQTRSASMMVKGWLEQGRRQGSSAPSLPAPARELRLQRLREASEKTSLQIRTCPCFWKGQAHVCHPLPVQAEGAETGRQLELFAS